MNKYLISERECDRCGGKRKLFCGYRSVKKFQDSYQWRCPECTYANRSRNFNGEAGSIVPRFAVKIEKCELAGSVS